jgi:hypothetical protein
MKKSSQEYIYRLGCSRNRSGIRQPIEPYSFHENAKRPASEEAGLCGFYCVYNLITIISGKDDY